MEVCELEEADFIQYRPAAVFGKETFVVVRVKRERRWFHCYRPIIEEFLAVLRYYQSNADALSMLKEDYRPAATLFQNMPLYAALYEKSADQHLLDSI